MNLFIALDFEPKVIGALQRLQSQLKRYEDFCTCQFEDAAKYHLTLSYLGNVKDTGILTERLQAVNHKTFILQLAGMGTFANPCAGVVWASVGGELNHLYDLKQKIDAVTVQLGMNTEATAFKPHITIAYTNKEHLPDKEMLARCKPDQICFGVTHFHLFAVNGQHTAAQFHKLKTFTLQK